MTRIKNGIMALTVVLALSAAIVIAAPKTSVGETTNKRPIARQVQHELVALPYYGVFDNLAYKVEDDTVTLYGQVIRPTTKSDAERRVARIEGVKRVINNIAVLPLSSFDDSIRARTYRAVFRAGSLYHYAMGANPSIHIVVNGGQVTLEGVVGSTVDKQLAFIAASSVQGAFSVTNNLRTEGENQAY